MVGAGQIGNVVTLTLYNSKQLLTLHIFFSTPIVGRYQKLLQIINELGTSQDLFETLSIVFNMLDDEEEIVLQILNSEPFQALCRFHR